MIQRSILTPFHLIQLFSALTALFILAYSAVLLTYARAFRRLKAEGRRQKAAGSRQQAAGSGQRASVVIAARNERENIGACLQSVLALEPLEVIVVDDHSTDGTAEFVEAAFPQVRLIRLSEHLMPGEVVVSFKKKALETGIAQAKGVWIFCTDADCVLKQSTVDSQQSTVFPEQPLWWDNDQSKSDCRLSTVDCRLVCLCGPVLIHAPRGFLQHFEALDVLNLAGVSGAGLALGWHHLGNGANLLFEKKAFEAVGGYASHAGRSSGDDVFLIQALAARYPGGVAWVHEPEAVVYTGGASSWRAYFVQRLRWGSKNAALPEWRLKAVLLLVVLVNAALCVPLGWVWGVFWLVKIGVDYLWLRRLGRYYGVSLKWFLPAALVYPFVLTASVLMGVVFKKVSWKGRLVR